MFFSPFSFPQFSCYLESVIDTELRRNRNGREQLVYNGHTFNRHVVRNDLTYWRCTQFSALRCRARCKTKANLTYLLNDEHNHDILSEPRKYGALKELQRQKLMTTIIH